MITSLEMRLTLLLLSCALVHLAGCKSLSNLASRECPPDSMKWQSFKELSGTYSDKSDTMLGINYHGPGSGRKEPYQRSILDHLFMNVPEEAYRTLSGTTIPDEERWVEMKFISEKRLIVSAYQNDRFIFARVVRGKLRNGYFYLRPRNFIIPFVPLFLGYYFEKARIGKCGQRLVIDYRLRDWGFALVAGGTDKVHTSSVYGKKAFK